MRIIELLNVSKLFGTRAVLNNLNFQINEGDLISIMGKSGSGKSTLLNILGFLDSPSKGEYYFENKLIAKQLQKEKIRNTRFSFVFQTYNLISDLTVYENIRLSTYYSLNFKNSKSNDIVRSLLAKYNLEHISDNMVQFISGGEKQRVSLARAVASEADVIFLDEPTGNLDSINTNIVLDELIKMNNEKKTLVIVTHDYDITSFCKQKYELKEGKLYLV